jgi:SAM-dependent methyltransferase
VNESQQPGRYVFLDFNAPLSGRRADAIAAALAASHPAKILDVGCGWGELLLRTVAASESAIGIGVDVDTSALERGRRNAEERGLVDRVEFVEGKAPTRAEAVDLVLCVGSDHAYGGQAEALEALAGLLKSGGRLLFGTGFWETPPTVDQAAALEAKVEDFSNLDELVDLAISRGFRPLFIQTANRDEWDAFESGYLADGEEWLHRFPDADGASEIRSKADAHRKAWLTGYRSVLGFAYLTLGRP